MNDLAPVPKMTRKSLRLSRTFHHGLSLLLRRQPLDFGEHTLDLRPLAVREEPQRHRSRKEDDVDYRTANRHERVSPIGILP
ncbi:MAG: hypothetical protein J6W70_05555, partial [Lentisphaeria bacterium]|nr:hypothetical protein [Lentisphaeria bacterium]